MDAVDGQWREIWLLTERHLWLTPASGDDRAVRPSVPVWFVWHEGAAWCCAPAGSARSKLLGGVPPPSVAIVGGGEGGVTGGGTFSLQPAPYPAALLEAFNRKFGWNLEGRLPEQGLCHPLELWRLSLPVPPSTSMAAPSMVVPPPTDVFAAS